MSEEYMVIHNNVLSGAIVTSVIAAPSEDAAISEYVKQQQHACTITEHQYKCTIRLNDAARVDARPIPF